LGAAFPSAGTRQNWRPRISGCRTTEPDTGISRAGPRPKFPNHAVPTVIISLPAPLAWRGEGLETLPMREARSAAAQTGPMGEWRWWAILSTIADQSAFAGGRACDARWSAPSGERLGERSPRNLRSPVPAADRNMAGGQTAEPRDSFGLRDGDLLFCRPVRAEGGRVSGVAQGSLVPAHW
jgi:hypothetical protein